MNTYTDAQLRAMTDEQLKAALIERSRHQGRYPHTAQEWQADSVQIHRIHAENQRRHANAHRP